MKIVVTGGAGFIGSAVCRHIVDNTDHEVINLDKLTYAANLNSLNAIDDNPRYKFAKLDICDQDGLTALFANELPDAVMHLAAESHVDRSITGPSEFINTNIVGTCNLLEVAREYWSKLSGTKEDSFRFLHVSTDEVYGALGDEGTFTEDTPYDPRSPYSASKAASDHLAMAWHHTYNMPILISNCSNNYGPYHFPEKLIPLAITNAMDHKTLPVYGKGANVRDWLYVEDHARALLTIIEKGAIGQNYNVGGREERSNLEVVQQICQLLDELRPLPGGKTHDQLIEFVQDRPGHDFRYAIDPAKLENQLGWHSTESFQSGLDKTVRWYLDNEAWWRPLRNSKYDGERLGLQTAKAG